MATNEKGLDRGGIEGQEGELVASPSHDPAHPADGARAKAEGRDSTKSRESMLAAWDRDDCGELLARMRKRCNSPRGPRAGRSACCTHPD